MTSPPPPSAFGSYSTSSLNLANRLRSGSSTSLSLLSPSYASSSRSTTPNPPGSGKSLSKAYRPRYHARSKSSTPSSSLGKPKVLPFPNLPVRPFSRDGSRAGSPTRMSRSASGSSSALMSDPTPTSTGRGSGMSSPSLIASPGWTPRGSSTDLLDLPGLTRESIGMEATSSTDRSGTLRAGRSTHVSRFNTTHSQSTSPTEMSLASASAPQLGITEASSRPRALTSPAPVDIPPSRAPVPPIPPASSSEPSSSAIYTYTSPASHPPHRPVIPGSAVTDHIRASSSYPPPTPEKDRPLPPRPTKKLYVNSTTTIPLASGSVPITPVPPFQPLQEHLYRSFLSGECADVRLWVRKWGVGWHVHKMVLVQAGFFHSLFLGGFSEMSATAKYASRKGKERADAFPDAWAGEDVELTFDDPNITRAAFEICLSRLYSSHPPLHFPAALLPTPSSPLTSAFSMFGHVPSYDRLESSLPAQAHLATPHLLLSLLATSIYLGHAMLMREVLAMILRTVGPATVGRYLGFALGGGCGDQEWDGQKEDGARGLEDVGRELPRSMRADGLRNGPREEEDDDPDTTILAPIIPDLSDEYNSYTSTGHRDSSASTDSQPQEEVKVGSLPSSSAIPPPSPAAVHRTISNASTIRAPGRLGLSRADQPTSPVSSIHSPSRQRSDSSHRRLDHAGLHPENADADSEASIDLSAMPHFYGFASNKIGEASACWLARWSSDILASELSPPLFDLSDASPDYRIFRHRGIPATFLRGLLSSDSFWVEGGEMGRYKLTREILDLRRTGWEAEMDEYERQSPTEGDQDGDEERWEEWEEDEVELTRVFAEGIYYAHMSFDDLSIIANDIDPTTHLPYAPLPVLQAAHWAAADLKSRILAHDAAKSSSVAGSTGMGARDQAELGLTVNPSELAEGLQRSRRRVTPRSRVVSPELGSTGASATPHNTRRVDAQYLYPSSANGSSSSIRQSSIGTFIAARPASKDAVYHPIPTDDTHRAGAGGLSFLHPAAASSGVPMTGVPDIGPNLALSTSVYGAGQSDDDYGVVGGSAAGSGGKKRLPPADEKSFFGLMNGSRTAGELVASAAGPSEKPPFPAFYSAFQPQTPPPTITPSPSSGQHQQQARWTPSQPFRFSVEFWDVDKLADKERLYSTTHFHAGSWWNVYVQTIRKKDKGTQLGVYLHRQSLAEGVPRASAPVLDQGADTRGNLMVPGRTGDNTGLAESESGAATAVGEVLEGRGTREETGRRDRRSEGDILPPLTATAAGPGRAGSFGGIGVGAAGGGLAAGSPPGISPLMRRAGTGDRGGAQTDAHGSRNRAGAGLGDAADLIGEEAYRDARKVTKAYFSITCASALGTALIRFSSSPDSFTLSQSWGWKSSALRSEEYLATSRSPGIGGVEGESLDKGVLGWVGDLPSSVAGGGSGQGSMKGSLRATVVVGVI